MAYEFPRAKAERTDDKEVRIRLDLTLDVPHEIAEQLELLGLQDFEACQYDAEYQRIKMSTRTVLFREGAWYSESLSRTIGFGWPVCGLYDFRYISCR